ncbi:vascular endothelial growth factor receptor 1-like [Schistocerca gregaria]|uniref:vascular endothelial growth factor receptor 1-like n=1 Tax=Schistocerca gregaria TaxID=7010 RepID=UPI00211F1B32|nr:vascular endothelial growth factor receptor 1-like [Schistocerca gregaria]
MRHSQLTAMASISSTFLAFAALVVTGSLSFADCSSVGQNTEVGVSSSNYSSVMTAIVGSTMNLRCPLSFKDKVSQVAWRRKDNLTHGSYNTTDKRFRNIIDVRTGERSLQILSVQFNDSGVYACFVPGIPTKEHSVYLSVIGSDGSSGGQSAENSSSVVTAVLGSTAYLSCSLPNIGSSLVHWSRDELVTDTSYRKTLHRFRSMRNLQSGKRAMRISSVLKKDSGIYFCYLPGVANSRHTIHFTVVEPEILGERTRSVVDGDSVSLMCVIDPSPTSEVNIEWTRDNGDETVHLHNNERITTVVERDAALKSTLVINNIQLVDAGNYTCTPSEGNSTATVAVHIVHRRLQANTNKTEQSSVNVTLNDVESRTY